MSETPWTKGPWSLVDEPHYRGFVEAKGIPLDINIGANARLISCAPELYEALDDILVEWRPVRADYLEGRIGENSFVAARKAYDAASMILAKARGETKDP